MPRHRAQTGRIPPPPLGWWLRAALALAGAAVLVALLNGCSKPAQPAGPSAPATNAAAPAAAVQEVAMDTSQSVVVTQDLDFGTARPSLAEALAQIDRFSTPDDGRGRTFAILEAFNGEWQPDGKMRVSLRISTEKPGLARVVFRRTNTELWKSRIQLSTNKPPFRAGELRILFDNGDGKTFTVDGSTNPSTILDAMLKEPGLPVAVAWPDGAERELSFIYSSCGCPIKVACRRVGARTERTKAASQVLFPDDPAAMAVINRLMAW